jgi:hypothetical protein
LPPSGRGVFNAVAVGVGEEVDATVVAECEETPIRGVLMLVSWTGSSLTTKPGTSIVTGRSWARSRVAQRSGRMRRRKCFMGEMVMMG